MDFVLGRKAEGLGVRCWTIVNCAKVGRDCPRWHPLVRILDQLRARHGRPRAIRPDDGKAFCGTAMLIRARNTPHMAHDQVGAS